MTVISSKDLDAQMGKSVDPSSIPKHNGASQGAMQAFVPNQSDHIEVSKGHGQRGSAIYNPNEIPANGFYGSGTVISVNDAPPLEAGLEPKPTPMPDMEQLVVARAKPPVPVAPVIPSAPIRQPTAIEMLARMGLKPKP